ncbi:MAG: RnfABCDGE type electron transport complex subunit B [Sulfuricaulis sp.]
MSARPQQTVTAEQIDARLPQTQCTQCGYPRCRAYAEAVARGDADINQCPPGDDITIQALASLLHVPPKPLDVHFGRHAPRIRAVIEESICIGCRKCIDVCPVDAILGARKLMHTVIAAECTGCALCLPPCPVDCIALVPAAVATNAGPWPEYTHAESTHWRARTESRLQRLARRERTGREKPLVNIPSPAGPASSFPDDRERIRAEIRAAVDRVRQKRHGHD